MCILPERIHLSWRLLAERLQQESAGPTCGILSMKRRKSQRKGLESCVCRQPGTPLLRGSTACAASFLLKLLVKAFSRQQRVPSCRLCCRAAGGTHREGDQCQPAPPPPSTPPSPGASHRQDHAPAGADGAVTSKHSGDICTNTVAVMVLSPPALLSLPAQRGRRIRYLGNEPPEIAGVVTMEMKKGFSAQLHQKIDLPPSVSQATC